MDAAMQETTQFCLILKLAIRMDKYMDVTIHNALLDKTPEIVNIGVENGQIVKITTDALSSGEQSFDQEVYNDHGDPRGLWVIMAEFR